MEDVRLFIGGLPETTTSEEIRSRFSKFGEVVSVNLAPVLDSKDPNVKRAIKTYDHAKWKGKSMRVEIAKNVPDKVASSQPKNAVADVSSREKSSDHAPMPPSSAPSSAPSPAPSPASAVATVAKPLRLRTKSGRLTVQPAAITRLDADDDAQVKVKVRSIGDADAEADADAAPLPSRASLATSVRPLFSALPQVSTFSAALFDSALSKEPEAAEEAAEQAAEDAAVVKRRLRQERKQAREEAALLASVHQTQSIPPPAPASSLSPSPSPSALSQQAQPQPLQKPRKDSQAHPTEDAPRKDDSKPRASKTPAAVSRQPPPPPPPPPPTGPLDLRHVRATPVLAAETALMLSLLSSIQPEDEDQSGSDENQSGKRPFGQLRESESEPESESESKEVSAEEAEDSAGVGEARAQARADATLSRRMRVHAGSNEADNTDEAEEADEMEVEAAAVETHQEAESDGEDEAATAGVIAAFLTPTTAVTTELEPEPESESQPTEPAPEHGKQSRDKKPREREKKRRLVEAAVEVAAPAAEMTEAAETETETRVPEETGQQPKKASKRSKSETKRATREPSNESAGPLPPADESGRFCKMLQPWSAAFSAPTSSTTSSASLPLSSSSSTTPATTTSTSIGSLFASRPAPFRFSAPSSSSLPSVSTPASAASSDAVPSAFGFGSLAAAAAPLSSPAFGVAPAKTIVQTEFAPSIFSMNAAVYGFHSANLTCQFMRPPSQTADELDAKFRQDKPDLARDYKFKHKLAKKRAAASFKKTRPASS